MSLLSERVAELTALIQSGKTIAAGVSPKTNKPIRKGLNAARIRAIAEKMDVQESWEELVAMIGK